MNFEMKETIKFPIILNQSNALNIREIEVYKNAILNKPTLWHKFIIHGGASLDRQKVLKTIVYVAGDIFPIQYEIDGKNTSFIARNCSRAIEILCSHNLMIKYTEGDPLILSIWLNRGVPTSTTLNIQNVITQVLCKRFTEETGVLNLENFVDDSDLANKVYCTVSQQRVLEFVLSLASGLNVKCLRLNNNELKNIDGLEVITWACPSLYSIDLRNNLIDDMSKLLPLKTLNITELWLEENPLCEDYEHYDYILDIREVCPKIKKLDGENLFNSGMPTFRKNFLITYSSLTFVDQFLEHYFTLYDSNRKLLNDLYHSEALFSLTCSFIPQQIPSSTARLNEYKRISRNLLNMKNFSKREKWLYHSSDDIVKILRKLPQTKHDPYTFTVDLVYYSTSTAVITVTGVFKDPTNNLLGFTRTFVLSSTSDSYDGEYNIVNEQLHITNATTAQAREAFKIDRSLIKAELYTNEDKSCIIETLVEISGLDTDAAKRLLEDTQWNLKSALTVFIDKSTQKVISSMTEISDHNKHSPSSSSRHTSTPINSDVVNVPLEKMCLPSDIIPNISVKENYLPKIIFPNIPAEEKYQPFMEDKCQPINVLPNVSMEEKFQSRNDLPNIFLGENCQNFYPNMHMEGGSSFPNPPSIRSYDFFPNNFTLMPNSKKEQNITCSYCHIKGHHINNCPLFSPPKKKQVAKNSTKIAPKDESLRESRDTLSNNLFQQIGCPPNVTLSHENSPEVSNEEAKSIIITPPKTKFIICHLCQCAGHRRRKCPNKIQKNGQIPTKSIPGKNKSESNISKTKEESLCEPKNIHVVSPSISDDISVNNDCTKKRKDRCRNAMHRTEDCVKRKITETTSDIELNDKSLNTDEKETSQVLTDEKKTSKVIPSGNIQMGTNTDEQMISEILTTDLEKEEAPLNPQTSKQNILMNVTCQFCHGQGHHPRDCLKNPKNSNKNKTNSGVKLNETKETNHSSMATTSISGKKDTYKSINLEMSGTDSGSTKMDNVTDEKITSKVLAIGSKNIEGVNDEMKTSEVLTADSGKTETVKTMDEKTKNSEELTTKSTNLETPTTSKATNSTNKKAATNNKKKKKKKRLQCTYCSAYGHVVQMCLKRKKATIVDYARKLGHVIETDSYNKNKTPQTVGKKTKRQCTYCSGYDHIVEMCFIRQQDTINYAQFLTQNRYNQMSASCAFCDKFGHVIEICPIRRSLNVIDEMTKTSGNAGSGNTEEKNNSEMLTTDSNNKNKTPQTVKKKKKKKKQCTYCSGYGHVVEICLKRQQDTINFAYFVIQNTDNQIPTCEFCCQIGHVIEVCPVRRSMNVNNEEYFYNY